MTHYDYDETLSRVSKLALNGTEYEIKDAQGRLAIEANSDAIDSLEQAIAGGTHFIGITTSNITDGSTTNPVVIDGNSVTAVAGDIVIKAAGVGAEEVSLEYIWDGAKWCELGSTGELGALAYKDSATSTDQFVKTASAGSLPSKAADTFVAPTFTEGTFSAGSLPSFTEGAFTPAEIQSGFVTAGSAASFTEGAFSQGTLPSKEADTFDAGSLPSLGAATTGSFATAGVTATYDSSDELLSLADASTSSAVTAQGTFSAGTLPTFSEGAFSAGTLPSKAADTFVANVPTAVDVTKFDGGSKASDTFSAGSLPSKAADSFTAGSFTEGAFSAGTLPSFTSGTVTVQ